MGSRSSIQRELELRCHALTRRRIYPCPDLPMTHAMQAAFETIAIMSQRNGRWRGEADNSPGHQDLQVCDWLRAGDFHDVQDPTSPEDLLVHKQDEYVAAADLRPCPLQRTQSLFHVCFSGYLQEESIRGELSGYAAAGN